MKTYLIIKQNSKQLILSIILGLSIVLGVSSLEAAWTYPTATPPGNNTDTPLNVGYNTQSKLGQLILNTNTPVEYEIGLEVYGKTLLNGGLQIKSGSPEAGKILTAIDNEGNVGWSTGNNSNSSNNTSSAGKVVNIYNISYGDQAANYGIEDATNLKIQNIIPSSPNSKFIINANIVVSNGDSPGDCQVGLFKGNTALANPYSSVDGTGQRFDAMTQSISFVDIAGDTSSRTYIIKTSGTCFINRDSNYGGHYTGISTMTVLEII